MLCNKAPGDVLLCGEACPTGALRVIKKEPEAVLREVSMGVAELDLALRYSYNNWSCGACYRACPFPEKAMKLGLWERPQVVRDACIGFCPAGWLFELTDKLRAVLRFAELPPAEVDFSYANKYVLLAVGLVMAAVFGLPIFALLYPHARAAGDLPGEHVSRLFRRTPAGLQGRSGELLHAHDVGHPPVDVLRLDR